MKRYRGEQLTLATTTAFAQVKGIPPFMNKLEIEPFHATTVEVLQVAFGPRVEKIIFYDASAARYIDITDVMLDRNSATTSGALLSGMTASDLLYVCLARSARGLCIDVVDANAVVATATWTYLDIEGNFVSLSATDGTASGGATLAQDGLVTWTVPNKDRWKPRDLVALSPEMPTAMAQRGYWLRLAVSATLTAPTTIASLYGLANVTVDSATVLSEGEDEVRIMTHNAARPRDCFELDLSRYSSVELASASLTSAINLNWSQC